jgi:transcriptional regulator with XRE-family HTH domain
MGGTGDPSVPPGHGAGGKEGGVKEKRKRRGLSLNVLAQQAGLSRQTGSYVEQEGQSPTLDTRLRSTLALEVDLADLIARP